MLPHTCIFILCLIALAAPTCVSAQGRLPVTPAGIAQATVLDAVTIDLAEVDTAAISATVPRFQPGGDLTIYDYPYSMTRSIPHWKNLWVNTGVLFAGGFTALGILELLPEDATAWNKNDGRSLFQRYADHFRAGPVWDGDQAIFNAVLHPYAGGAYYMSARSQGFNVLGSLLYCVGISTFFWEYGIECFMEVPSMQDLIITPLGGAVVGEAFYVLKRHIVNHDYRLFGSKVFGNIVAFIIDPVNEVIGLFRGNPCRQRHYGRKEKSNNRIESMISPTNGGLCLNLCLTF